MMIANYVFIGLCVMITNYVYRYWESKGFSDREEPTFMALAFTVFLWPACLLFLIVDSFMKFISLFRRN